MPESPATDLTYPTDTPGRWFGPGWHWRVFPPGEGGELPGHRVLAWKVADDTKEVRRQKTRHPRMLSRRPG